MKILVEIPHTGMFPWQFVHSFPLMVVTAIQKGIGIEYELRGHSLVYDAREGAGKKFLESDCDYMLFLDSDMMPTADMLTRLIEHDKPIVSALAFKRVPNYEPCIFKTVTDEGGELYHDYPKGLVEVEGVGMACTLMKKEVFEKVPQPWFRPSGVGEDLAFCKRAREAGFPIYCDTNLICKHIGSYEVGEEHYINAGGRNTPNSKDWWETEHSYNWVNTGINGIEQTKYFADTLLNNLPMKLYGDVLDYGCAFGQMTKELSKYANATGYDYSRTAIEQAQKMYHDLTFTSDIPQRRFNFVVSSNVLEHYENPVEEMRNQLKLAKDYFIAMTPYKDGPNETHPSRIDENTFPEEIDGFKRESVKVVETTNRNMCYCPQIIFVYRRVV